MFLLILKTFESIYNPLRFKVFYHLKLIILMNLEFLMRMSNTMKGKEQKNIQLPLYFKI